MSLIRGSINVTDREDVRTTKADNSNIVEIIDGDTFNKKPPVQAENPKITLKGSGICSELRIDEKMLSTHVMILGGIGTGKSNTFYHLISQTRSNMTKDDVAIIFDTKGDFLEKFKKEGDVVISNDDFATGPNQLDYWNIFEEIDKENPEEHMRELCRALFKESIDKSSNAYFPTAASDLLYALMHCFYHRPDKSPNNKMLLDYVKRSTAKDYLDLLGEIPHLRYITNHISDPHSPQTQGVIAEMNTVLDKVFIGNFAKEGNLSMHDLVKEKYGRTIFIEYDIKTGEVLTPIYSLLIDMAIKQALSKQTERKGSVYIFVDEFKLLPNLSHIDDAVNFGRSLGIKMVVGLQTITQMYDNYGEYRAKSILSGFLNNFFFRVNNYESREFIKNYFGESVEKIMYRKQNDMGDYVASRTVVKDKDIARLNVGEAIIAIPNTEPFVFKFEEWC